VFIPFLYELRRRGVPAGLQEAIGLARALSAGLHDSSLEGFYYVARSIVVHREGHLDAFDQAFSAHFRGIEIESAKLREELFEWLEEAVDRRAELSEEERELLDQMSLEELKRMFEERLREQNERHDGGSKWIGTGGTSPFGHSGAARKGIRVGGKGGNRSAVQVADARQYRPYRSDLALDVRQMQMALRRLRAFARQGGEPELDIEETIAATAKNAGELDIVTQPPKRPNTRVVLMMDVGGSMDPYSRMVSRLFTAAKKSTHIKELHTYYFHNCVYGRVYRTEGFDDPVMIRDLLREVGPHYKLIMVGDASMAPYELLAAGGSIALGEDGHIEGVAWLQMLEKHFRDSIWLNPEPEKYWGGGTIAYIRQVFDMYALTLDGLSEGVQALMRSR